MNASMALLGMLSALRTHLDSWQVLLLLQLMMIELMMTRSKLLAEESAWLKGTPNRHIDFAAAVAVPRAVARFLQKRTHRSP